MLFRRLIIFIVILSSVTLFGQQKFYTIENFITENGDTIRDCKIGFRTFGALSDDSSNAVIFPTWFAGRSEHLKSLVTPDRFVDTTKYFVIAVDALGNGISSSPSNYPGTFPLISVTDMVVSQYKLVTGNFHLKGLYGAIGGSMGGMQVFEWVSLYPGFIKKAISYVGTPSPTLYDKLQWSIREKIITNYKAHNISEFEIQQLLKMQGELTIRTPDYLAGKNDVQNFDKYLKQFDFTPDTIFNSANYLCQLKAMLKQNIYKHHNNSMKETADAIKAELLIMVSESDHLVHPKSAVDFAGISTAKLFLINNNCGHLAPGCQMEETSRIFREFFE